MFSFAVLHDAISSLRILPQIFWAFWNDCSSILLVSYLSDAFRMNDISLCDMIYGKPHDMLALQA